MKAKRIHPFPSRTRKLSSFTSMILGGRLPGKVESCRNRQSEEIRIIGIYSSIAQLAEHAAVNRRVVGSSPTWGAKSTSKGVLFCFAKKYGNQRACGGTARANYPTAARGRKREGSLVQAQEQWERQRTGRLRRQTEWFEPNLRSQNEKHIRRCAFCFAKKSKRTNDTAV